MIFLIQKKRAGILGTLGFKKNNYLKKRNLTTKEIRVAQLAGYVSEHGAYHHGEMSLHGTIINMAQDYTGSNNINLLDPIGQFGTRIMGGKDSAQPRYIHTKLMPITNMIFNKFFMCRILKKHIQTLTLINKI